MKLTVDYDVGMSQLVAVDDVKELAWLDDERVKLSTIQVVCVTFPGMVFTRSQ